MEWVRAWKGDGMNRDLFAAAGGVVDATTDPYFNSTTLLLSGDGTNGAQNNTFVDSSANNATITRAGSPTQGSFSPFSQTGWSGYFNGTGNYLYATNSVFNPGATGAWTLECFVYPLGNGTFYAVGNGAPSGNNMMSTYYNGSFGFSQQNGSSYVVVISSASSYTAIQWYHYAVSKDSSNVIRLFINGIQVGTQTYSSALTDGTTVVINGRYDNNGLGNDGATVYLSQLRWMKGTSLYTTTPFAPPTAPLTAITGTSLLTLQDNRFKDNSTNNFTITAAGTPSVQAFSPFAPTAAYSLPAAAAGSAYFNGTSNYLTPTSSSTFAFGTGAFTIEFWINPNSFSDYQYIIDTRGAGADASGFAMYSPATGLLVVAIGNAGTISASTALTVNRWQHIAVSSTGTSVTLYLNGTSIGTGTYSTNIIDTTMRIGTIGSVNGYFYNGYVSNFRVVKGTAVYTAAFTPPSAPLTAITNTSLLTLQDSTFKDNSSYTNTITASSPAPVIQSFTPFTQVWGGNFDGSSYLSIAANSIYDFGSSNFTAECWIYPIAFNAIGGSFIGVGHQSGSASWYLGGDSTGAVGYAFWSSGTTVGGTMTSAAGVIAFNRWNHVAVTRNGNTWNIWSNGTSVATMINATAIGNEGRPFNIAYDYGSGAARLQNCYMSNVRIVKGVAVYTGTFTPPAKTLSATQAAGTNISAIYPGQTSLLTLQDPTFKDNATLPNTITAAGTPKAQLVSAPFTSAATVDPVSGSGYFDGSSYISVPDSTAFTMGSGDFTLEAWVYLTTSGTSRMIFGTCDAAGSQGSMSYVLSINASNNAFFAVGYGGSMYGSTNTATVPTNQWVHIAGVRSGANVYVYLNGMQSTSNTNMGALAITDSTQVVAIGRNGAGNFEYLTGYISNARITKGTAVYTANFQPPTAPLTAVTGTSLLTLQDTTFIDKAGISTITASATPPVMRAFTPFASNWGGYFSGTTDSLSIPSNANLTPQTLFTFECWLYPTVVQGTTTGIFVANTTNGIQFAYYGSSGLGLATKGNAWQFNGSVLPIVGQWNHVALCRGGTGTSQCSIFLNGVRVANGTAAASFVQSAYEISSTQAGGSLFQGYISNARFVNGVDVYGYSNTTYTPPSAPLTAITNTSLLTLQNNTFIDNSTNALAITATGAPKTQLLQLPFTSSITKVAAPWNISVTAPLATVGGSMYFTGSSTTADKIAVTSSAALGFGTGAYTIEYWYNPSIAYSGGPEGYSFDMGSAGNGTRIDTFGNSVRFYYNNGATALIATAGVGIQPGAWYHLAIVRTVSSDITIYINGVACGTVNSAANETSTYISIGGYGGPTYNIWGYTGYISNFRVVKGTAVYTGNFTPPAAPPQPTQIPGLLGTNVNAIDGTNTSLLLLGTNAGIYDATAKNDIITVGNAQVSSTQIKYGTGAMYFDGTGDKLVSPPSELMNLATGDFTVECWIYTNTTIGTHTAVMRGGAAGITSGEEIQWNIYQSGTSMTVRPYSSTTEYAINVGTITSGVWYHVALVRSGSTFMGFLNGVKAGTTQTISGALNNNILWYGYIVGLAGIGTGDAAWNGYLDDLRITKAARYTTTFTPPTKAMIGQ